MLKAINRVTLIVFLLFSFSTPYAQEIPLTKVVVSEVSTGTVAPEAEFIGTVYYQEISDVASEVYGKVEMVKFEEGKRIKKGHVLVKLGSDLLKKTLQATKASHEQVLSELEEARRNLKRAESLYKEELIAEQIYDEHRFRVKGLEKKSASLKAEVERLETELQKKTIKAPFDGVVIKKHVDRGEWLSPGSVVATIARDDIVDVVVEVPERIIKFITPNMEVIVKAGGKTIKGKVLAIIPRGDISTRTIPIKIRVKNRFSLIEGMEAKVALPMGPKKKTFIVPRDAIISMFGRSVVFAVIDSKARMIPVKVIGYKGMMAGIYAEGLKEGMKVIVKGNERLRDGQIVNIK
jgi:RND family efflux transporter MFP subunit